MRSEANSDSFGLILHKYHLGGIVDGANIMIWHFTISPAGQLYVREMEREEEFMDGHRSIRPAKRTNFLAPEGLRKADCDGMAQRCIHQITGPPSTFLLALCTTLTNRSNSNLRLKRSHVRDRDIKVH